MGALFRQPVLTCSMDELMQLLHAHGLKLYGAALTDAAQDLRRAPLTGRRGDRQRGPRPERAAARTVRRADHHPYAAGGAESLNAAVAAAVVMWEIARAGM